MRVKNSKTTKISGIFIAAVISFAAIGASVAHWEETLTISGVMTTDDIHPVFANFVSNDDSNQMDPDGCGDWIYNENNNEWTWTPDIRRDKNVGNTDIYSSEDDQTLNVIINDAYPCYFSHVAYMIRNIGSCPVLINKPLLLEELSIQTDPADPSTHFVIDIEDIKLEIGTWYFVKYWENNNNVWRARVVEGPVDNPENYDFSIMPTGSDLLNTINTQLDPWSWRDNPSAHMQDSNSYLSQIKGDLCIHFENNCMQNAVYDFKIGMNFYNWPEFTYVPPQNAFPISDPGESYLGHTDEGLTLDGSSSYDSDGTIVSYEWDLDFDGQFDDAVGVNPTYTWHNTGDYQISLKVTDDKGDSDVNTTTVTINQMIYVDDDADPGWYDTYHVHHIYEGMGIAQDNDKVYVYDGVYFEKLVINKLVTLEGESNTGTDVYGGFYVRKDGVVIKNFRIIKGYEIRNYKQSDDRIGIYAISSFNTFSNNYIYGIRGEDAGSGERFGGSGIGIYLKDSINSTIESNTVYNVRGGTGERGRFADPGGLGAGIYLDSCENINISSNSISAVYGGTGGKSSTSGGNGGRGHGICLMHSHDSIINSNSINNIRGGKAGYGGKWDGVGRFGSGIHFEYSENNIVKENSISSVVGGSSGGYSEKGYGFFIWHSSENNLMYHNNLQSNEQNARDDTINNMWDNGSEGNYYDDYTGTDLDNDGIGDSPRYIPNAGNMDNYPLMNPI